MQRREFLARAPLPAFRPARRMEIRSTASLFCRGVFAIIADRYHIHNVELQTMYLRPETSFIAEFSERLKRAKSKLVSIAAEPSDEINQALGSEDEKARANDDPAPLTDSAKKLVNYGRTKNVVINAEPRGSSRRNPDILAKVMRESGMRATRLRARYPENDAACGGYCHIKYTAARYDMARLMGIIRESGYKRLYTIEAIKYV